MVTFFDIGFCFVLFCFVRSEFFFGFICNRKYFTFVSPGVLAKDQEIKQTTALPKAELITYNKNLYFLGVTFDEQLCFKSNIEVIRSRALKLLNMLKFLAIVHGN
jgi:hypothetical protein